MKSRLGLTRRVLFAILAVSVVGTAAASVALFSQIIPALPAKPQAIFPGNCGSALKSGNLGPVAGLGGTAIFFCDSTSTGQAFTTLPATACPAPPAACIAATPTFTLPAPYTGLFIVDHTSGVTDCSVSSANPITSGNFVTIGPLAISALAPGFGFDYCAAYSNAPSTGLPTFTITWTQ